MGVHVDESGHHPLTGCVDQLRVGPGGQRFGGDGDNPAVPDPEVAAQTWLTGPVEPGAPADDHVVRGIAASRTSVAVDRCRGVRLQTHV